MFLLNLFAGLLVGQGKSQEQDANAKLYDQKAQDAWQDANLSDRNAAIVLSQASDDERKIRVMTRRTIGAMRANFSSGGLQADGNALDLLEESAAIGEEDARSIRVQGNTKAATFRRDSMNKRSSSYQYRDAAASSRTAGQLGMFGSLLGTAADIYDKLPAGKPLGEPGTSKFNAGAGNPTRNYLTGPKMKRIR